MANGQQQVAPPGRGMTPQQYFMSLYQQGMSPSQAYQYVQQYYGSPGQYNQQQQQDAANNAQIGNIAGTVGTVGGVLGGSYIAGQIAGLGAGAGAAGAGAAGAGAAGAGAAGAGAAGVGAAGAGAAGAGVGAAGAAGAGAGAAGAAGASGAGAGASGAAAGAGIGAVAVPAAIVAGAALAANNAWETGMKDIVRGRGDSADWTNQLINHFTGLNVLSRLTGHGSIGRRMKSGKGEGQLQRDQVRAGMQELGLLDDKYMGTLADGTKFDFGVDGKPMSWREFDKRIVDTPSYNKTVALTDAMATGMGLSGMQRSNINLLFSRAAQSNAGDDYEIAKSNVLHFANQFGITSDTIKANTQKQFDDGLISRAEYDTYMSLANEFPGATKPQGQIQNAIPAGGPQGAIPIRPPEGEVLRVSPGLYRTDTGTLQRANDMRSALERAYNKNS